MSKPRNTYKTPEERKAAKRAYRHQYWLDHKEELSEYRRRYRMEHENLYKRKHYRPRQEEKTLLTLHDIQSPWSPDKCVAAINAILAGDVGLVEW